jgi:hypothetical protein
LNALMRLVRCCRTPKCRARHVTVSPGPISPDIRPPTACSPVCASDTLCKSMLRSQAEHALGWRVDVHRQRNRHHAPAIARGGDT